MSIHSMLNSTCDIQVETDTKTDTGSFVATWADVSTDVACRVAETTPNVAAIVYGKYDATTQKRVYFDTENNLTVRHRLIWNGQTLYVHSTENAGGNLDRLWQVDVATYPVS